MDRLSIFEYGSEYYVGLVDEFFTKSQRVGKRYEKYRAVVMGHAYNSYSAGEVSGVKPRVWAAAMIRMYVLEPYGSRRMTMDELAKRYGVTEVAIRNTIRRIRSSKQ